MKRWHGFGLGCAVALSLAWSQAAFAQSSTGGEVATTLRNADVEG